MKYFRLNMLAQFSLASFLILAVIAVVLAFFLSGKIESDAFDEVTRHIEIDTSVILVKALNPADLETPMVGERLEQFDEIVQRFLISDLIALIRIWNKNGSLIYSSDHLNVTSEEHLKIVLSGSSFTHIDYVNQIKSTPLREYGLLEVNSPIRFPGDTSVQGVFEIFQYYSPTLQHIYTTRMWIFAGTGIGFLALYASLVCIVWRGSQTIKRQKIALTNTNVSLEASREDLEQRVEERTSELTKTNRILRLNQKALQDSEQNFRSSIDDSPLPILINKGHGKVVYSNQAMIDIFGYASFDDFINRPSSSRYLPEYQSVLEERWRLRGKGDFVTDQIEHVIIRADGEKKDVESFTKKVIWNGKESVQIIYNDITERKQMEKQLRHSQVLASLGEMTAGIAHEVGNPLASIVLYSEVALKGEGVPGRTKKDLRVIRDEAKRAGSLMKDLLAYSRKLEPNMRQVNVQSVMEKVVKMLQYQLNVQDIKITTNLLKGTLNVNGDAAQLTQVFMNLIINAEEAVKGRRGGKITVSSSAEEGWAKIAVTDNGIGIPAENMDQIFLPFFTTKDIGEGTGLGLSTCYGIITSHEGFISAENNENGGATFTVILPLLGKGRQATLPMETEKL